jgi:2-methylcitrate dehydratase PrpD
MIRSNTQLAQPRPAAARIADFAAAFTGDSLTGVHFDQTARALIDTVAVTLAGRREPAATIALEYVRGRQCAQMATAWGIGERLPLEEAALYNGVAGHVLDFDDVTSPLRGHPSIALLPALLALSEAHDKDGKQLVAAFVVGFEVLVKMAKAMVGDHYAKGWHSTSSIGVIAATAAGSHLLGLSREQMINALGIAVAQASGTRANFGTMAKSFQAGHCGASAVRAVMLAQRGFTGADGAIDGAHGYMALYANGEDLEARLAAIGKAPLEIESSGIEIKKYPLCYATHRTIDGTLDLRAQHGLTLDQIEQVEIVSNYRAMVPLIHQHPITGLEAKFSMQYAVAAALQDGFVRLSSFEDAAVLRAPIQEFFAKVCAHEEQGPALSRWNRIRIKIKTGKTLEKVVTQLRGAADCPLTNAELIEKANDCLAFGGYRQSAQAFADVAFSMEHLRVREILKSMPVIGPLPKGDQANDSNRE